MALTDDVDDKEWLQSLLLDVQLEHFLNRIIDELQVSLKISTIFLKSNCFLNNNVSINRIFNICLDNKINSL